MFSASINSDKWTLCHRNEEGWGSSELGTQPGIDKPRSFSEEELLVDPVQSVFHLGLTRRHRILTFVVCLMLASLHVQGGRDVSVSFCPHLSQPSLSGNQCGLITPTIHSAFVFPGGSRSYLLKH